MIKVSNVVEAYEVDGKETTVSDRGPSIVVESHWNRGAMVVLQVGTGQRLTILAKDLEAAIANATNSAKAMSPSECSFPGCGEGETGARPDQEEGMDPRSLTLVELLEDEADNRITQAEHGVIVGDTPAGIDLHRRRAQLLLERAARLREAIEAADKRAERESIKGSSDFTWRERRDALEAINAPAGAGPTNEPEWHDLRMESDGETVRTWIDGKEQMPRPAGDFAAPANSPDKPEGS